MPPDNVAEYRSDPQSPDIEKRITVRDDNGLDVEFETVDDRKKKDKSRTLSWDQFTALLDSIEAGTRGLPQPSFTRNVFVGGHHGPAAVGRQYEVSHRTTLGGIPSGHGGPEDYYHLYYRVPDNTNNKNPGRLVLRPVKADSDGSFPDGIGSFPPRDRFEFELRDSELQMALVESPAASRYPVTAGNFDAKRGFSEEFREALFVERDRRAVLDGLN